MLIELFAIGTQPPTGSITLPLTAVLAIPGTLCTAIAYLYVSKEKLQTKILDTVTKQNDDYNKAALDTALAQNKTAEVVGKLADKIGIVNV